MSKPTQKPDALSRRRALQALGAAALAGWVPGALRAENALIRRPIPSSGELLPAIGLGTAWAFDVGSRAAEREPLREILIRFAEPPGRLIDTSPMYGNAETVIGDLTAEAGIGGSLFMATKVWTRGQEAGIRQMEQSLRRLRRDSLDLIQVHNLVDWRTQLKTLRSWKDQGRVRYIGITHYQTTAFSELERLMRNEALDFVQFNYSIATRDAEQRLLPLAADRGIAVIINRPFENGALFRRVRGRALPGWAEEIGCRTWAQFFLKYIVSHKAVTCAIPATGKPRHLEDNLQAGVGPLPGPEQRRRMVDYLLSV
jgi:diketogulonate reductase-like aldo/keto reductase